MTPKQIFDMLNELGIDVAYRMFDNQTEYSTPFAVWYFEDSDDLYADDSNYCKIRPVTVELYTDNKEFELESRMEALLAEHGLTYRKNETYIESELMYMVIYESEVIYHG